MCAISLRNACITDTDCIPEGSVVYIRGRHSNSRGRKWPRGPHLATPENTQANSCDYSAHASERFWNGKRSHCPVGPFWNVLKRQVLTFRSRTVRKGTVPFTLCLATVPERWERSRRCNVNGVLVSDTIYCRYGAA